MFHGDVKIVLHGRCLPNQTHRLEVFSSLPWGDFCRVPGAVLQRNVFHDVFHGVGMPWPKMFGTAFKDGLIEMALI